jgi:hypothetical protein
LRKTRNDIDCNRRSRSRINMYIAPASQQSRRGMDSTLLLRMRRRKHHWAPDLSSMLPSNVHIHSSNTLTSRQPMTTSQWEHHSSLSRGALCRHCASCVRPASPCSSSRPLGLTFRPSQGIPVITALALSIHRCRASGWGLSRNKPTRRSKAIRTLQMLSREPSYN